MRIKKSRCPHSTTHGSRGETFIPVKILNNLCKVRATHPSFCSVHCVCSNQDIRLSFPAKLLFKLCRDFKQQVRLVTFYRGDRLIITGRHIGQPEITGRKNLFDQLHRYHGMIMVNHSQIDITHFEIGGKRQDKQLHQRYQKDDAR